MELHQEMAQRLQVPLCLDICGKTPYRMGCIAQTGMACFHFDSKNHHQEVMDTVDGRIALVENINKPEILYARRPEGVRQ